MNIGSKRQSISSLYSHHVSLVPYRNRHQTDTKAGSTPAGTGSDFSFIARQKRITVDKEDYYLDLLFYHRQPRHIQSVGASNSAARNLSEPRASVVKVNPTAITGRAGIRAAEPWNGGKG